MKNECVYETVNGRTVKKLERIDGVVVKQSTCNGVVDEKKAEKKQEPKKVEE